MEYIEYYRIIRERIWLLILTGALAALAVIAMRVMPGVGDQTSFARGTIEATEAAKVEIAAQGGELLIGYPKDERTFWDTLVALATNRAMVDHVANKLKLGVDPIDEHKLSLQATKLGEKSNLLELRCSSNDRDISVTVLDAVMAELSGSELPFGLAARKILEARQVVEALERRLPILEQELADAQRRVESIEEEHGGLAPDKRADIITNALNAVQIALQSADLEAAGARARSEALAMEPRLTRTPEAAGPDASLLAGIDSVRQQLMDRETQLTEMLAHRTPEHPSVKALQKQIEDLRQRLRELEAANKGGAAASTYVQEASIAAKTYASEMAKRREVLAQREAELRSDLSKARTDLITYQEAIANADAVQQRFLALKANIASAKAELHRRENLPGMVEVRADARLDKPARGITTFLVKLAMATFAGIGLGILVIFVLYYVDTTFKNEQEAARLLGCPILAGIPHTDIEVVGETAPPQAIPGEAPPG